ncbi:glycine betaine/proline transport system substrate-binding protein [Mycoplana sp. BE70]|uniref:glycine betaine/L-proline ABC transporter substrate-binding protein ProX n=1 Tax=Mycoplana sp. BE70 TaxID=2817775 RepID=UPI0028580A95|nr:glycine betaine/L-proline ABC transporter substrate-binding protein ProX [Mycoplana sp. BE70]MDR6759121.1 glycine betaine/proline transport system substrate-binding protein [Mycoplana sp. BE70]
MKLTGKHKIFAAAAIFAMAGQPVLAQDMPGEGKTLRFARSDSLGANYVQDVILIEGLKKLGYDVQMSTLGSTASMLAASQGDMDFVSDINMPQQEASFVKVKDKLDLIGEGSIIGGGTNGYYVDKKTAEAHNITNIEQLKDPKIAALFDTNGDGKADMVNCDPGWRCGDVVDYQVEKFGLNDTVQTVRAKYEVLLAETFARFKRGEPVLLYTWTPSWVTDTLKPGVDAVWLPIPFDALPENVTSANGHLVEGIVGCAGGQDPCRMTTGSWNWMMAVNKDFINANPAVKKFVEVMRWPTATWAQWETELNKDSSDRSLRKLGEAWIAENQATFDGWVVEAAKAVSQ